MTSPALDAIGRYQLLERIGAGGMAEVLLALAHGEAGFARQVVVKRLLPELVAQPEQVEAFLDEARLLAGLAHSNIVQVLDLGRDPRTGAPFMVLEHLRGRDLRAVLASPERRGRPLPPEQAVAIARGIVAALEHVHARDILHRDISPHNVFITVDGAVKLLDFGIARHARRLHITRAGTIKGKFGYMAPEQCKGESLSPATDLFAVGVVLYECSTGRRAFAGDSEVQVLYATLNGRVPPPSEVCPGYPPALESLVLRLLAPRKEDRPATASAVGAELASLVAREQWQLEPAALAALATPTAGGPAVPELAEDASTRDAGSTSGALFAEAETRAARGPLREAPSERVTVTAAPAPLATRRRAVPARLGAAAVALGVSGVLIARALAPSPEPAASPAPPLPAASPVPLATTASEPAANAAAALAAPRPGDATRADDSTRPTEAATDTPKELPSPAPARSGRSRRRNVAAPASSVATPRPEPTTTTAAPVEPTPAPARDVPTRPIMPDPKDVKLD